MNAKETIENKVCLQMIFGLALGLPLFYHFYIMGRPVPTGDIYISKCNSFFTGNKKELYTLLNKVYFLMGILLWVLLTLQFSFFPDQDLLTFKVLEWRKAGTLWLRKVNVCLFSPFCSSSDSYCVQVQQVSCLHCQVQCVNCVRKGL